MKFLKVGRAVGCLAVFLAGVSVCSAASSVYVSTTGVDAAGRGTAEAPFRTIQYAVTNETACDGLTINIAGGLYEESVTNSVGSSPVGHHAVKFIGSWKSDFSARDLRNARTLVRPPAAFLRKRPCFYLVSTTNRFDGIDVTGGSVGIQYDRPWVGGKYIGSGGVFGDNDKSAYYVGVSHCAITNNVDGLNSTWQGFAVASSLIADNTSRGYYQCADHGTPNTFNNCTFARNGTAIYLNHSWNASATIRNGVFIGNGYDCRSVNAGKSIVNCCFGAATTSNFYTDGRKYTFYSAHVMFKDPKLDDTLAPTADSPFLKLGSDVSTDASAPVVDDFYGTPWNGAYDFGCFKSDYPALVYTTYAQQYVSTTGSDAADGTTRETARATISCALEHLADGGTLTLLPGIHTDIPLVGVPNATIEGESELVTTVRTGHKALAALELCATNITVRNLTLRDSYAGVLTRRFQECDKCFISNCVMTANTYGISLTSGGNQRGVTEGKRHTISHCRMMANTSHGLNTDMCYRMDNSLVASNGEYGVNGNLGDMSDLAIAVNCTVADNKGKYGIFEPSSWAGSQAFYNSIICGNKIGVYRATANYSGSVGFYNCVMANETDFSGLSTGKILTNAATICCADARLDRHPSRLYWPLRDSPVVGVATNWNQKLAVKISTDLNYRRIKLNTRFVSGCFQLPPKGLCIFLR